MAGLSALRAFGIALLACGLALSAARSAGASIGLSTETECQLR